MATTAEPGRSVGALGRISAEATARTDADASAGVTADDRAIGDVRLDLAPIAAPAVATSSTSDRSTPPHPTQTSADPAKSQLLELRAFQVLEAARLWRVPPHKLGDYSKASYASVEQSNLAYMTETLRPICESIESVLDLRLLTDSEVDQGFRFEFDFSSYLRADTATRSAWLRNMSASGLIKIDEGRAIEGLPPLPDGEGDRLMVPLNTAPLESVLADDQAKQAQEPPK